MNLDLLITIGVIAIAAIYLLRRHFSKKSSGCCGCSGCSNSLEPRPPQDCCSKKD